MIRCRFNVSGSGYYLIIKQSERVLIQPILKGSSLLNNNTAERLSRALCGSTCLITTHTHIAAELPTVSEACWSQGKLPLHILSARRKCQSACPSQLKRCVYASKCSLLAVLVLVLLTAITLILPGQFLYSSF